VSSFARTAERKFRIRYFKFTNDFRASAQALQDTCVGVYNFVLQGEQLALLISIKVLARFMELEFKGADTVFNDNYIDIPAGDTVSITCPLLSGLTVKKARKVLQMQSLYQSFA
jgi:hypothetical protein